MMLGRCYLKLIVESYIFMGFFKLNFFRVFDLVFDLVREFVDFKYGDVFVILLEFSIYLSDIIGFCLIRCVDFK